MTYQKIPNTQKIIYGMYLIFNILVISENRQITEKRVNETFVLFSTVEQQNKYACFLRT